MNTAITSIPDRLRAVIGHQPTGRDASQALLRPRPGIYHGSYPGKQSRELGRLSKFLLKYGRRLHKLLENKPERITESIACVHTRSEALQQMNDKELDEWISKIRGQLYRGGLTDENIIAGFTLIREVARRELSMAHFDCQLMAGFAMMSGEVAEMQTGEGKTLTATLPVSCAAMAGIPVHLITANDYLVKRDLELMQPVYERLGLSSGCILADTDDDTRRAIYRCDIVYCTAQQLVFDYLKDRMVRKPYESDSELRLASLYSTTALNRRLLLRGLNFAIVDEADSVLIDEARTPLILSRQTSNNIHISVNREAVWLAKQLETQRHFLHDSKQRSIELTAEGKALLENLTADMHGVWCGENRRTALIKQALSALYNFKRDIDYVVIDNKVVIVDENTGRMMPDRSWEAGLHQMIEEKENCEQSGLNETIARISFQRFFARYHRLAGMTGTASEVSAELEETYGLSTMDIPTNKPSCRLDHGEQVFLDKESKWKAIAQQIKHVHGSNRPILVGTRTLEDSEIVSDHLSGIGLQHRVLNAKQNHEEADIVAMAGRTGQITVATNMAGRGTDIPLTDEAHEAGGLHVICCEKNMSSRIDRQLFGRSARQGDPGSYECLLSLEDDIVAGYFSLATWLFRCFSTSSTPVRPATFASLLIRLSQFFSEIRNRQLRKIMTSADDKRDAMMAFTGKQE